MARVRFAHNELEVQPDRWERLAARGGSVRAPRSAVRGVEVVHDALSVLRGARSRGSSIPEVLAAGTWRHVDGVDFVLARCRQRGLRLTLDGRPWQAVLVGLSDPASVARELR